MTEVLPPNALEDPEFLVGTLEILSTPIPGTEIESVIWTFLEESPVAAAEVTLANLEALAVNLQEQLKRLYKALQN
jgi:hypothetical protein